MHRPDDVGSCFLGLHDRHLLYNLIDDGYTVSAIPADARYAEYDAP